MNKIVETIPCDGARFDLIAAGVGLSHLLIIGHTLLSFQSASGMNRIS